jgi:hypothetical protein
MPVYSARRNPIAYNYRQHGRLVGTFSPQRLSDKQAVNDRASQIVVVFMAVTVLAAAQGEKPTTPANTVDASNIILTPRPLATLPLLAPHPETSSRPTSSAATAETLFGMPLYNPKSTSSYISSVIAAGLPKYDPLPKTIDLATAGTNFDGSANHTTPGITLLPAFIVRDTKIPNEDQILTSKAKAKIAMDKYLGPSDGLDRGLLNRYTLKQLWMKIPMLRAFPIEFVGTPVRMSNEDRALDAGGANDTIPYPHPPPKAKDGSDD